MNRPIKFRLWNKVENKMFLPEEWSRYINISMLGNAYNWFLGDSPNNYVVQQFTGLLDKDGREIYEGDICSYIAGRLSFYKSQKDCVISFKDEPSFYGLFISSEKGRFSWSLTREFTKSNLKVIGNIFETPELLSNNP